MAKEEAKKLSYEELEKYAINASQENQALKAELQKYVDFSMFKRLDYLFKVVEHPEVFKDADFVGTVIEEIKVALYPPVQQDPANANPEQKGE